MIQARAIVAFIAFLPYGLRAATPPIEATVPADGMAVFFSRPSAEMSGAGEQAAVENLGRCLASLKAIGLLPQQGRIVADVISTLPLISRRPYAVVLLDITAKELGPGSYRLNDMKSAMVIDGRGIDVDLDRRVRDLLATYTDAQNGRVEPVDVDGLRYFRLADQRLPDWAVSEWGTTDGYFVVGFGRGSFETILAVIRGRSPALAADTWYTQAHRRCGAIQSGVEVYVAIAGIRKRIETVLNDTVRQALAAVQLDRADRALLTVGFDGRALHSELLIRDRDGIDYHKVLTGKEVVAPEVLAQIPDAAGCFVAFRLPLAQAIRQARTAYYQTQASDRRARFSEGWAKLESEFHFDVETGLLNHLGDHVVYHSFPPHPLNIPLMGSIWIQTDSDRAAVAGAVDGMMSAWQHYANAPATDTAPARFRLSPQLFKDADGVWYLQIGLLGPALAVTNGWIVISFSPEAVRQNLAHLAQRPAATQPASRTAQVLGLGNTPAQP